MDRTVQPSRFPFERRVHAGSRTLLKGGGASQYASLHTADVKPISMDPVVHKNVINLLELLMAQK